MSRWPPRLDAALDRLLASGELERIYSHWNLWNEDQEKLRLAAVQDITTEAHEGFTFAHYFTYLLEGAGLTVVITLLSMALAILLALPIALGRLYGPAWLQGLAMLYVEFFRGIPVLLLLYFLYYGLAGISAVRPVRSTRPRPLHGGDPRFRPELRGLRGGDLPGGHRADSRSANGRRPLRWACRRSLTFRRIILPQAIRIILPPMTNDFVALFKDTSLVSVIARESN